MIQIAICEDNKEEIAKLTVLVKQYLTKLKVEAKINTYLNSMMLEGDIEEGKYFDILISDIEMPEKTGMELAQIAKMHLENIIIIFVTAHLKYAAESFELSVFRYVQKVNIKTKLYNALRDAVEMIRVQQNKFYILENSRSMERIPYSDILYLMKEGKNTVFVRKCGKKSNERKAMSEIYAKLDQGEFVNINRCEIVNIANVVKLEAKKTIIMCNGEKLYPAESKVNDIIKRLSEFWGRELEKLVEKQ